MRSPLHQVLGDTNILDLLSKAVVDAEHMIQELKQHWLLRPAFKTMVEPNNPAPPRFSTPRDPGAR